MKLINSKCFQMGFLAVLVSSLPLASQEERRDLSPEDIGGIEELTERVNEATIEGRRPIVVVCRCEDKGIFVSGKGSEKSLKEFLDKDLKVLGEKVKEELCLVVGVIVDTRVPTKKELLEIENLVNKKDILAFYVIQFRLTLPKEK